MTYLTVSPRYVRLIKYHIIRGRATDPDRGPAQRDAAKAAATADVVMDLVQASAGGSDLDDAPAAYETGFAADAPAIQKRSVGRLQVDEQRTFGARHQLGMAPGHRPECRCSSFIREDRSRPCRSGCKIFL
jgi:hypothetical protein